jgi:hypothetical protein
MGKTRSCRNLMYMEEGIRLPLLNDPNLACVVLGYGMHTALGVKVKGTKPTGMTIDHDMTIASDPGMRQNAVALHTLSQLQMNLCPGPDTAALIAWSTQGRVEAWIYVASLDLENTHGFAEYRIDGEVFLVPQVVVVRHQLLPKGILGPATTFPPQNSVGGAPVVELPDDAPRSEAMDVAVERLRDLLRVEKPNAETVRGLMEMVAEIVEGESSAA